MDVMTPNGLADHAESVSSYLYDYGRGTRVERRRYSQSFFKYLLASSWKKLYSRFTSWRALSFVMKLENAIISDVIGKNVKDIGNPFCPPELPRELGRGDRTLADFFKQNKAFLLDMMTDACGKLPESDFSKFSPGVNPPPTCSEFVKNIFCPFDKAVVDALSQKGPLYTKESAVSFHYLLYFSFLLAGTSLRKIKESHLVLNAIVKTPIPQDVVESYKQRILAAELPFRLLVCVLSSSALRFHLNIWTNNGMELKSILPLYENKSEYLTFGMNRGFISLSKKGPQVSEGSGGDITEDSENDITEGSEDDITEVREPIC
jgi:hypothetical protein